MDWKKEIKLGDLVGRKDSGSVGVAAPPDEQPAEQRTSLWKRELRVRKPKEETDKPERKQLSRFAATPSAAAPAMPGAPAATPTPGAQAATPTPEAPAARPGPEAPAVPSPDVDQTNERRSRFARFTKAGETSTGEPGTERKPSRFARTAKSDDSAVSKEARPGLLARLSSTGITLPKRSGEAKAPKDAAASSRRSLELSFRRKPKQGGGAASPARRGPKKGNLVGLKIGASHIAAAHVMSNGHSEVVEFARDQLQRGIVVAGEVRDPDALGAELKEFFRKHKLPQRAVRLGVGTNRVGVRRFEISGLSDPSHLENAIRFRAQEVLPIPLEEAVLDYQVVGETTDESGKKVYRVLLVVAYRDLIQRYVIACRAAGLKLVGIDLEAFALLRSLGPTSEAAPRDAAVVVVSIGHDRSTFVVADGPTCEFARVLDWGGGALDVAVARTLDLTPSQAEPIKQTLTLNATQERMEGYTDEQAKAVYEAVRKELQTFVRELVSSLHFYQNQPGSLGIAEITITGGTAQLPGLAAELQRLIGVTVRVGDPFGRVTSSARIDSHAEVGSLAVAIGLGMEV